MSDRLKRRTNGFEPSIGSSTSQCTRRHPQCFICWITSYDHTMYTTSESKSNPWFNASGFSTLSNGSRPRILPFRCPAKPHQRVANSPAGILAFACQRVQIPERQIPPCPSSITRPFSLPPGTFPAALPPGPPYAPAQMSASPRQNIRRGTAALRVRAGQSSFRFIAQPQKADAYDGAKISAPRREPLQVRGRPVRHIQDFRFPPE